MAREYKAAEKALKRDEENPFSERDFELLLVDPVNTEFDAAHRSIKDVAGKDGDEAPQTHTLRTQIIQDPTRPIGGLAEILQFFAQDPNRDDLMDTSDGGVIFEVTEGKETALLFLTPAEVHRLVRGEGYAYPLNR